MPYRPEQNPGVERKHQHLLNVTRALMIQGNLPIKFWGDAVCTATHLINRTPSPLLKGNLPFELFYDKVPVYESLRVFGCLAYTSTIPKLRHKLPLEPPHVFS